MKRQVFIFSLTAALTSLAMPQASAEEEFSPLSLEEELAILEKELVLEEQKEESQGITFEVVQTEASTLEQPPTAIEMEKMPLVMEEMVQTQESTLAAPSLPDAPDLPSLDAIPQELPSLTNNAKDIVSTPLAENREMPTLQPPTLQNVDQVAAPAPLVLQTQPLEEASLTAAANISHEETLEESLEEGLEKPQYVAFQINFGQVFAGAPIIYSLLLCMSMAALFIWLYNFLTLREARAVPETLVKHLRNKFNSLQYEEALALCLQNDNVFCKMLACGIATRKHGLHIMLETMKSEGQRATVAFWQRLALLNDIAIIAPMLGLLGTVIGMFYAFYDVNRSFESLSSFFDGLGVSIGTTVAGLIVAILALILHSVSKYRLVRHLAFVENEAQGFAALIEHKTP